MFLRQAYYTLKFLIPRPLQIELRRYYVNRKRSLNAEKWPIDPNACKPPEGWSGWPDGKKFAFVLTHDIEKAKSLENCLRLSEMEERLGFRSAFYFVAGDYSVPDALRQNLTDRGFEIGIHGLHHDNNPFRSESVFRNQSIEINRFLKKWGALGFRSPSMYHDLEMLHHLDIEYDASTFDTDPFEPQPDGMSTIFPFLVPGRDGQKGYVELPYTLPQDFLLFVLMQEKNIDIWKKKLDWIAEKGGMALLIAHPGYMRFNNSHGLLPQRRMKIPPYPPLVKGEYMTSPPLVKGGWGDFHINASGYDEYPVKYYEEFLEYIKSKYEGQYWNALPRDVSRFWVGKYGRKGMKKNDSPTDKKKKIWIDLDNSPHVPFFKPILEDLHNRGYDTLLTARDCFQVCGLADLVHLKYKKIGRHYGKHVIMKVAGLVIRALQLMPTVMKEKPDLAVSHGSRSQVLIASILNIPTVVIADYEFTQTVTVPTYVIVPEMISDSAVKSYSKSFFKYPGIKEDVYVPDFKPDPSIYNELGISERELIVTIRPPATEAHYHNPESELLFKATMNFLVKQENTRMVVLPRNEKKQTAWVKSNWSEWCDSRKIIFPEHVVDGLNLIWHSDLVISGGGTMNREAAALGVPVYSIFRGKIGAVDRYLSDNGRLTLLETVEDVQTKILLNKRDRSGKLDNSKRNALGKIVELIETILREGR
jgi:predicted glycosyltransferase/peptidoglycan/xylan/chitin deacetylase (PgdA/CDA1 family)